jgi:hypothetical protein
VTHGFFDPKRAINRGHLASMAVESTASAALRALGELVGLGRQLAHLSLLNPSAEPFPQSVGTGFDGRVMGDAHQRPLGLIEGHRDLCRFEQKLIEFLPQGTCRFIHDLAPPGPIRLPQSQSAVLYHEILGFSY